MGSNNSIKISAVVITYNEEDKIGRCLDSLRDVADEIIVIDSLSTDRTVEICKSKGATVISQEFLGYIEQKNFALDKSNFDYVLSVDADEVLSPELIKSIIDIKSNFNSDAYEFNRLTNYCGKWIKHGGWYPDVKTRIWNKNDGRWGGTNPHDKVILENGKKVKKLQGDLLHYSIDSISQHIYQIQNFTTIAAQTLHKKGHKTSISTILFNSWFKFIRDYFLRLGFLDGFYGFVVAFNSAFATYLKYLKLYDLQKRK